MNYSYAFKFFTQDKDWLTKMLIAGLISLIPVVGWIYIGGWMLEVTKRVIAKRTDVLPETQFVDFIKLGLKSFVVAFVYMIPVYILSSATSITGYMSDNIDSDAIIMLLAAFSCVISLLNIAVSLFLSVLLFAGLIKLAETGSISDALKFGDAWIMVKNNLSLFCMLLLFDFLISIIASLGLVACFIGIIFTFPYAEAVFGHLLGQAKLVIDKGSYTIPQESSVVPAAMVEGTVIAADPLYVEAVLPSDDTGEITPDETDKPE